MSQGQESFQKEARLTRRSEFVHLSRTGRKAFTPHFIVIRKDNDQMGRRLGVTVSSKVGNAVIRNRVKRELREFFRRQQQHFRAGQDTLIIARKGAGDLSQEGLETELRTVLGRRRRPSAET